MDVLGGIDQENKPNYLMKLQCVAYILRLDRVSEKKSLITFYLYTLEGKSLDLHGTQNTAGGQSGDHNKKSLFKHGSVDTSTTTVIFIRTVKQCTNTA